MFEMAVDGDGLKHFGVDSPAGSAELMNEQRRYGAEVEIGSVEVGAFSCHLHFLLDAAAILFNDPDAVLIVEADRFDNPHQAIGDGPIDLRQVPPAEFPSGLGRGVRRRPLSEPLGLAQ